MATTAATVINIIRDLVPDPVYDGAGNPLPATDGGLFRSQTLVRWINDGVKALSEQVGWIVEDWTAFAVVTNQPYYPLNSAWISLTRGWQSGFQIVLIDEGPTIWPRAIVGGQPINYTIHKTTDHTDVGLFPVPNTTDPTTTLVGGITATATSLTVASVTGMLPYGYLQIDNEILFYGAIAGAVLSPLIRGQCSTTAAIHNNAAPVGHLSAWFKGMRNPNEITTSTDPVEIPNSFLWAVQEYVMAKCSIAQNDPQAGKMHMDSFRQECKRIQGDTGWRSDAIGQAVAPYGQQMGGRLNWGPFGVLLP